MTTRPFTAAELHLLDRELISRGRHRDRLYLQLSIATGFRSSEILTLTFGQLLGPGGEVARQVTISRRFLKGGRGFRARAIASRRVVLGERARSAIREYITTLDAIPSRDSYVFASRKGENRPITRCHAAFMLKALAAELGIEANQIGSHSARKTFAHGVYEASGHDLLLVQRALGHASCLTTASYISTSADRVDALISGLDLLSGSAPARQPGLPAHKVETLVS